MITGLSPLVDKGCKGRHSDKLVRAGYAVIFMKNPISIGPVAAIALIVLAVVVLMQLPQTISPYVFAALVGGAVSIGVYRSRQALVGLWSQIGTFAPWLGGVLLIVGASVLASGSLESSMGAEVSGVFEMGMGFIVAGLACFMPSLGRTRQPHEMAAQMGPFQVRWWALVGALAGFAGLTAVNLTGLGTTKPPLISDDLQMGLLGVSLVLLMAVIRRGDVPNNTPQSGLQWWPIALVLVVAFGLRVVNLGSSIEVFVDEVLFADELMRFNEGDGRILEPTTRITPFTRTFSYFQWLSTEILGRRFFGLRYANALVGWMGVAAVYLLGRHLFNNRVGLCAAAMFAAFPPDLHYSRIALVNVDTLMGVLALACFARGAITRQPRHFWLGGVALGLTHYYYDGGRFLFTPLVLVWLALGCILWQPRLSPRFFLFALIPMVIISAPFYRMVIAKGLPLVGRFEAEGVQTSLIERLSSPDTREQYIKGHLQPAFQHVILIPDSATYYMGDKPLLLGFMLPFFFLGILYSVSRWRHPNFVLVIWTAGGIFGNSLLDDSHQTTRFVPMFPALILLCAVGLVYGMGWLLNEGPFQNRLVVGVAALLMALNATYYFGEHLERFNQQTPRRNLTDAALRVAELPAGTEAIVLDGWNPRYFRDLLDFWGGDVIMTMIDPEAFSDAYLMNLFPDRQYAFLILPHHQDELARLQRHFILEPPQITQERRYLTPDHAYILYLGRKQASNE